MEYALKATTCFRMVNPMSQAIIYCRPYLMRLREIMSVKSINNRFNMAQRREPLQLPSISLKMWTNKNKLDFRFVLVNMKFISSNKRVENVIFLPNSKNDTSFTYYKRRRSLFPTLITIGKKEQVSSLPLYVIFF